MRKLFLAVIVAAFAAAAATAQDAKPKKAEKPEPSLKVGDTAPTLKADKWLHGSEVKAFEPSKVYVVEFWATWCGPCIAMMPHMADMQREYRDKGVTFIGFAAKDPGPTPTSNLETVSALVKRRGEKLGYTFAYADGRDTYDAWMKAAGQGGIPCSYVVGKDGKLAYIGHPMYLDWVLPKVVGDSWNDAEKKALKEIETAIDDTFKALSNTDAEVGLKAIADLVAKYPEAAHIPYFKGPKLSLLMRAKKTEDALAHAKKMLTDALVTDDNSTLGSLGYSLRTAKDNKDLGAIAIQAVDANAKSLGDTDFYAQMNASDTHNAVGDKSKAKDYVVKAIGAAKSGQIVILLRSPIIKEDKALLADVLKTAQTQLQKAGDTDAVALMGVAESHFALGDKEKAKEFGEKAVEASKNPNQKKQYEARVKKFEE